MTETNISVPYVALGFMAQEIKDQLMEAFEGVLDSGQYILGPEVVAFEQEFANFCGSQYGVGVNSGTCSLHLILRSLGLSEADEIITVPNSFMATAATIALAGARPVFVDINQDLNIDPTLIEAAITSRTKAILPVHLTGRPAAMVEIMDIAERHDLFVLEDAAQAIGSTLEGKPVGSWGHAACFSLHPLKNLHAIGDGGMLTTDDENIYSQMNLARNHGLSNRDRCEFWSFNCRLDELQAALLRVQLKLLNDWNVERRRLAFRYNDLLKPYVGVPTENPGEYCTYQTYMIRAELRDDLQRFLADNQVQSLVHYPTPLHLQPPALGLGYTSKDFPVTMKASKEILSLPLYPGLTTEQQDLVVTLISDFYSRAKGMRI